LLLILTISLTSNIVKNIRYLTYIIKYVTIIRENVYL